MIKQDKKGPKLRVKGGECRSLIPFALRLAMELHELLDTPFSNTVLACFSALMDVYMTISTEPFMPEILAKVTRKFLLLYGALLKATDNDMEWKIKPKFHLMQELGEFMSFELGNPRNCWAYKDESLVGFIADVAASRGGANNPGTLPNRVVDRVRAMLNL